MARNYSVKYKHPLYNDMVLLDLVASRMEVSNGMVQFFELYSSHHPFAVFPTTVTVMSAPVKSKELT